MTADPVLRASDWADNGRLIADLARLGYLRREWLTLDPTYGDGTWWKHWRPDRLVTRCRPVDGSDFTAMPDPAGTYDAVAFDPPYVIRGGRDTAGIELAPVNARYGLVDAPRTPAEGQELINAGLGECWRVVKPGGIVLVKCQDYVSSGKVWMGTAFTYQHACSLGLVLEDYADLLSTPRPQPHAQQKRLRGNTSRMWVFRRRRLRAA